MSIDGKPAIAQINDAPRSLQIAVNNIVERLKKLEAVVNGLNTTTTTLTELTSTISASGAVGVLWISNDSPSPVAVPTLWVQPGASPPTTTSIVLVMP